MARTIDEKLAKGFIHFTAILEIVGKPKDHVESTFAAYINELKASPKYEIVNQTIHEAIEVEGSENLFSAFAELEVLAKNMGALYDFCFECMPASVEILAPAELKLRPNEASAAANDLLGRIHQLDMQAKQMNQQIEVLSHNLRVSIKNAVIIHLAQKPHTIEAIASAVGIGVEQLKHIMDSLIKENRVTLEGTHYAIAGVALKKKDGTQPAKK